MIFVVKYDLFVLGENTEFEHIEESKNLKEVSLKAKEFIKLYNSKFDKEDSEIVDFEVLTLKEHTQKFFPKTDQNTDKILFTLKESDIKAIFPDITDQQQTSLIKTLKNNIASVLDQIFSALFD